MSRALRTATAGVAALALSLPATATAATSVTDIGRPQVVNLETVDAQLTSAGQLDTAHLFSQLVVTGKGTVVVADPVSTKNLRNLDGFSAPDVVGGKAIYKITVNGTQRRRTVGDFTKQLPVVVRVNYTLNGKAVKAQDILGKSGDLTAIYTIVNMTGTPTVVSWKDGKGVTHTETVNLVTPYVGQLNTDLPSGYTNLNAPRADAAADGKGGTSLTWSMVLFEPIGQVTQTFGWRAHVDKAIVPPASIQLVPVSPTKKPELKFGVDGYKNGSAQAGQLTSGASQIDQNLGKLQSGVSDLLTGLTAISAGQVALNNGLNNQLAPGAAKVATGATDAASGSAQLSAGTTQASTGADQLAAGINQILVGVEKLPTTVAGTAGYQQLVGALTAVQVAIGHPNDTTPTTLLGGLNLIKFGLRSPLGVTGCSQTAPPGSPTACGAIDAVQLVQEQLAAAAATGGALDSLIGAAQAGYVSAGCPAAPAGTSPVAGVLPPNLLPLGSTCFYLSNLAFGLGLPASADPSNPNGGVKAQTATAAAILHQVFAGVDASIIPGIDQVKAGLSNPACNLANPTAPANPCGIYQVQGLVAAGIGQLVQSISSELTVALKQASVGADDLAAGLSQLATGQAQLTSGLDQLATGAGQLSTGTSDAAHGSQLLVDGTAQAKAGTAKAVDGAKQLRSQGTGALVTAANATTSENAEHYAVLVALGAKAQDGALPYGAPEGATGSAAYQLTLAGATTQTKDNWVRTIVALVLLGAAIAASMALRRRYAR